MIMTNWLLPWPWPSSSRDFKIVMFCDLCHFLSCSTSVNFFWFSHLCGWNIKCLILSLSILPCFPVGIRPNIYQNVKIQILKLFEGGSASLLPHPIMVHLSDIASIKCEKPFRVLWNTIFLFKSIQSYTFDSGFKMSNINILLLIFKTWPLEQQRVESIGTFW